MKMTTTKHNYDYRYILRYLICPTHHAQDRIEELAQFCRKAKVKEVMLLFTAEELTTGHPTLKELEPWVDIGKRVKERLEQDGVALSLNPWTTTFHVARGRKLKSGQNFTLMVGETGSAALISACPLCENWQKYICETFAYMCHELKPTALWVEDDWRLHNHEPEMKYGGCFCDLHMSRFAKLVNKYSVTREELLENILAPGKPHPWRKIWIDLCRDTLLEPAHKLRKAVQNASPATRLALMSSVPDVHSIEGRNWGKMQEAWGYEPEFMIRPHLPPYTETRALQTAPVVTRQTLANLNRPLKVYPELENSPRCGIYSKSKRYTIMECLESVCYGADGITINHFDMMGNGTTLDPLFDDALAKPKVMLDAVATLEIDDYNAQGAAVLFSPQVATYRQRIQDTPEEISGLQNDSTHWANVLSMFGISYGFVNRPVKDRPVFVNDQTLRAFSNSEIEELLKGILVCDAQSVEILIERGFSDYIGVKDVKWASLNETGYGYEEIINGASGIYGIDNPRMSASRCSDRILAMQPAEEASVQTVIQTGAHEKIAPGMTVYRNSFGGTVIATAYPLGLLDFYMGYFNIFRQKLWQELLFELCPKAKLAVSEASPLRVYRNTIDNGEFIGLINPTLDTANEVTLRLNNGITESSEIELLTINGEWQKADVRISTCSKNVATLKINTPIEPLKAMYLRIIT